MRLARLRGSSRGALHGLAGTYNGQRLEQEKGGDIKRFFSGWDCVY